jgi:hypothetical protein
MHERQIERQEAQAAVIPKRRRIPNGGERKVFKTANLSPPYWHFCRSGFPAVRALPPFVRSTQAVQALRGRENWDASGGAFWEVLSVSGDQGFGMAGEGHFEEGFIVGFG